MHIDLVDKLTEGWMDGWMDAWMSSFYCHPLGFMLHGPSKFEVDPSDTLLRRFVNGVFFKAGAA